jgi:myosin-crossreactive antigen
LETRESIVSVQVDGGTKNMSMSSEATQSLARSAQHYDGRRAYLVGGGIASLAAAAFLIRDGDLIGANITIIEESARLGGSLDGAGSAEHGYVLRGGRMLESKYLCTYALFDGIPTLSGDKSVTDEIFDWNKTLKTSSKSRLVRNGRRETAPALGLSERQILSLERLALEPEALLGRCPRRAGVRARPRGPRGPEAWRAGR